jgi:hypothetical protein
MNLNFRIKVVCPQCGRQHPRVIKDGQIHEDYGYKGKYEEEICPPKSAYHKEPWTKARENRGGVPIKKKDVPKESAEQYFLNSSWQEKHGG